MTTSSATRLITPHDKEVAQRLKSIYNRKKDALNITQKDLEKMTGYKQATISCHMNGHIALRGTKGLMAYADALQVSPDQIDPRYKARFAQTPQTDIRQMSLINLSGEPCDLTLRNNIPGTPSVKGYLLGEEYLPLYNEKTVVVTDKDEPIVTGKLVVMKLENDFFLARIEAKTQRSLSYVMPYGFEACREHAIRTGASKEHIEECFPVTPKKLNLTAVKAIEQVVLIEFH